MSLVVLYFGTMYDVCECNTFRDMTISSFFVTFDLRLWPSLSVKVTLISIIRWTLCCCVYVPSTKFVGSIEFEIWTIVKGKLKWRHNDVITNSIFMKLNHKLTKSIWPWLRIGVEVWRCKVISVFELRFLLIHANFLKIFLFFLFSTSLAQLPDKMYDSTEKNSIQRRT